MTQRTTSSPDDLEGDGVVYRIEEKRRDRRRRSYIGLIAAAVIGSALYLMFRP